MAVPVGGVSTTTNSAISLLSKWTGRSGTAVARALSSIDLGAVEATPSLDGTAAPSREPYATATPRPAATQAPSVVPGASPKPASSSVRVTSIRALLAALADDATTDIVVANGTYRVSAAASQRSNSLWIGSQFAGRTRPVTVRAETPGGVTFDGGGVTYFGGLSFVAGAHDQTWDGFDFANGQATETGVVTFGGAGSPGSPYDAPGPYRITLRHITILGTCTGQGGGKDHAFYFSSGRGSGPHDLLLEDIAVDGSGLLSSALHFYHSDATHPNASNVTIRRLTVTGTKQAIMLWDPTLRDITIDGATITNAVDTGVRYETVGATGIVLSRITSTGSGLSGFFSSQGSNPVGVTFIDNSFH